MGDIYNEAKVHLSPFLTIAFPEENFSVGVAHTVL